MIDRDKIMADARIKRLTTSLSRDEICELNRVKSERTVKRKGTSAVRYSVINVTVSQWKVYQ